MALTNPWFINGPDHDAATARQIAYQATGGKSGIAGINDLKVRQTGTPGTSVEVLPGSYVVTSRHAAYQSYSGRNIGAELVEIPASGSTGSKTWYVGIEITDPEYPLNDGPEEGEENTFEYVKFAVRSSRTHTSKTWYPLAKIVVPANTATITNSMITSLRELSNPRRETVTYSRPRIWEDGSAGKYLNALWTNGGEYFPGGGGSPNEFQVEIPEWATRMNIRADWIGVGYNANTNPYGSYVVQFGDEYRSHTWPDKRQWEYSTQAFSFNSPGKGNDSMRMNWPLADAVPIASKLRGKTITFAFVAGLRTTAMKGQVFTDGGSGLTMEITFAEKAIDADTL